MLRELANLWGLVRNLNIDPNQGVIRSKQGVRYVLFSDDMVLSIQETLERIVGAKAAEGLAYRIGFEAGVRFASALKETLKGKSAFEIAKRCAEFAQVAGWGKHKIWVSEDEEKAVVIVYSSPLSELGKGKGKVVCHFHRGLLAGSASVILGKDTIAEETSCIAKGDDFCKFLLKPKD